MLGCIHDNIQCKTNADIITYQWSYHRVAVGQEEGNKHYQRLTQHAQVTRGLTTAYFGFC